MDILLLLELILNFVDIYDVLLLDSAFTNKKIRPHWKLLLYEKPIHLNYLNTIGKTFDKNKLNSFLTLILHKGIKLNSDFIFSKNCIYDTFYDLLEERFFRMMVIHSTNIQCIDIDVNFCAIKYIPIILQNNKKITDIHMADNSHSYHFCHVLNIFNLLRENIVHIKFYVSLGGLNAYINMVLNSGLDINIGVDHAHLNKLNISLILNPCNNLKKLTIYDDYFGQEISYNIFNNEHIIFPNLLETVHIERTIDLEIITMAIQNIKSLKKILYKSVYNNTIFDMENNMAEFKEQNSHIEIVHIF
jgi:hypothetical protein